VQSEYLNGALVTLMIDHEESRRRTNGALENIDA
jgi:hypothetical protein